MCVRAALHTFFFKEGDSNVTYLFVRKQFEWTLQDFSMFNAARIVVQIVGSILGMFILRRVSVAIKHSLI